MLVPGNSQVPFGQFQVLTYAVTSSIIGTNRTLISMEMKPHDSQKSLTQFPDSFTD